MQYRKLIKYRERDRINDELQIITDNENIYVKKKISPRNLELYQALQKLDNDYVIKIYDIISERNENYYAVEEYIEGETVYELAQRKKFTAEEVKYCCACVCKGLEALHALNIVHRDISYNNVMVSKYGKVKIIDFDISHFNDKKKHNDTEIRGTAGFAAPEQYGFMRSDEKVDIYAVGSLMNFMLENCDEKSKYLTAIAERASSFVPENRFPNIKKLRVALEDQKKQNVGCLTMIKYGWYAMNGLFISALVIFAFVKGDFSSELVTALTVFACNVFPVMLFTNEFNWQDRFPSFKYANKGFKIFAEIIIYIFVLIILMVIVGTTQDIK